MNWENPVPGGNVPASAQVAAAPESVGRKGKAPVVRTAFAKVTKR
jgi:hypothetical protein